MLSNTLNTNEIKDAAAAEVEFQRLSISDRSTVFAKISESPALEYRLTIKHLETGKGVDMRRRSLLRFDKNVVSTVDSSRTVTCSAQMTVDLPIGAMSANTEFANVIANVISFAASLGASTTILYDCTGNGATVLLGGGV